MMLAVEPTRCAAKSVWGLAQAEHKIQSAGVGEQLHLTLQKARELPLLCSLQLPASAKLVVGLKA